MNKKRLDTFRRSLIRHKNDLMDWIKGNGAAKRMRWEKGDGRRKPREEDIMALPEIDNALGQIEHGTFGKCEVCAGEVEPERLVLDFTTSVCLDHYSEKQKRELERDLELAARVQRHLLPGCLPAIDGFQLAVLAKPAGVVGGDYYDFFRYRDYWQGLVIADVMGKGVPAGLLMANLQASLRILGPEHSRLDSLAGRLNELFRYNLKLIRFITLFLAAVDVKSNRLYYLNAGHNPPLLWDSSSRTASWLMPTGPAIGLAPEAEFTSGTVQLDHGDLLILYTDGLVEARNKAKEEFGQEGLTRYALEHYKTSAESFLDGLIDEVHSFAGSFQDDLTVMILKKN